MHSSSRNMAENFLILLLHLLVIMCSSHGRELGGGTKNNMNHHMMNNHHHDIDPSLMVFLTMKDLKVGQRMPIYFPKRDPSTSPKLWPKQEADSVPFSLEKLPQLLQLFGFAGDSAQAKAMEDTLRECESKPIKREVKFCATSLDSMLDFAQSILGKDSGFRVLSTSHKTKSSVSFQNYTMLEDIKEMEAPKMVACHTMPYPYGVFYCHSQTTLNKVYRVPLEGDNGDKFATSSESRKEPGEYGKMVMKNNEISEGIQGLLVDGLKHKCEDDKKTNIVRNFEPIPNVSVYKEDINY
ncbi:hypothetical protein Ahy_A03g016548 isoform E [Arachis hypogaea]|uniref:BURP domain-containing protein n=1 Tax=Arachis hypogaea TaxID=3818 RepID=A0A445E3L7_ARAHY|nr:hypothetical protein Ahy_A03g016548 isoform E [Arachis hypogaea]